MSLAKDVASKVVASIVVQVILVTVGGAGAAVVTRSLMRLTV